MSDPFERYLKLGLKESFPQIHQYPLACTELSVIIRHAYSELPKNLQSLLFQDTLSAFRLLPEMQTKSAVSAAYILHQSAEAAFLKKKRVLAFTEFKHAKIAHKRRFKAREEEEGSTTVPQDVLVHIFSFLDMRSLVSAALVCWSWNSAASEDSLWRLLYVSFFGNYDNYSKIKGRQSGRQVRSKENAFLKEDVAVSDGDGVDWRDAFKGVYIGNFSKKLKSDRGYCLHCNSIVWLKNMKCSNMHNGLELENQKIKPVSPLQIVEYLLDDPPLLISSSDSDPDSDGESISKLWAYPRHTSAYKNHF